MQGIKQVDVGQSDASVTSEIISRLQVTLNQIKGIKESANLAVVGFHGLDETKGAQGPAGDVRKSPNGFLQTAQLLLTDIGHELDELEKKVVVLRKIVD